MRRLEPKCQERPPPRVIRFAFKSPITVPGQQCAPVQRTDPRSQTQMRLSTGFCRVVLHRRSLRFDSPQDSCPDLVKHSGEICADDFLSYAS